MDIDKFLNQHEQKDLLRFLTCGSVDDGKSTLIGRLLYDSKLIFEDQLKTLKTDSEKVGTTGEGEMDYALLLDGLKAEREQGITIDVAYRYFSTPKRKFIIADTPGHEQYTRNMATGASTADLAIILIDARYGVVTQTKRHSFIVSLLGIRNVIVAINKMDLVDYSKEVFDNISQDFKDFISTLDIPSVNIIPLSALKGDNVVDKSKNMLWFKNATLLESLETVDVVSNHNMTDFRFPVQFVNRPNLNFRGFSGSVVSGVVKVGDSIKALPSMKESKIKKIVTYDGDLEEAFSPQAVTLELEDEIDISSGEMIVHANNVPKVSSTFEAIIIWMHEKTLESTNRYILRHTSTFTKARIDALKYVIDVNTLEKKKKSKLEINEIARVLISSNKPIFFDSYSKNRETGSFILIDELTNYTIAAGMIIESVSPEYANENPNTENREILKKHIDKREFLWENGLVSSKDRTIRNRHTGKTVIFTGVKGKEKHKLAKQLELELFKNNFNSYYLGMKNIFEGIDSDIGSNFISRDEHIRRLGELARIMTDAGLIFITAIDNIDDYDLETLKLLNSPNELLIVAVGDHDIKITEVDLSLNIAETISNSISSVMKILNTKKVIPEYYI